MRQSVSHRTAQACQFNRLKRQRAAALVQPRKTDNVLDQLQQAHRLGADFTRKTADILRPRDAILYDLRITHDAGQRGFQFMGHIRGKLLALPFRLITFGDINHKQHRCMPLSSTLDCVG